MTPAYASPEQVRGESITTASDVYQLGIVLYELLTGYRPYRLRGRAPSEIERIICEENPTRPSAAVAHGTSEGGDDAPPVQVSTARQTNLSALRKTLRGELDTIVMKALRKEPDRRYASAEQLAEDLERYLAGRPVAAHADTWTYRTRTFIRRHRWGVGVAVVIGVLLASSLVGLTLQNRRIAEERDRARIETMKAEHVKAFLIALFGNAWHNVGGPDSVAVRASLDSGVQRLKQRLSDQPEIRAEMMSAVAAVYQRLGDAPAAQPLLESALATHRSLEHSSEVAALLFQLAEVAEQQEATAQAEALYREALAIRQAQRGDEHIAVAQVKNRLAQLLETQGRDAEAVRLYAAAAPVYRREMGEGHTQTAVLLGRLGALYQERGQYAEADPLLRDALAIHRRTQGAQHPSTQRSLEQLIQLYEAWGKPAEAAEYRDRLEVSTETDTL